MDLDSVESFMRLHQEIARILPDPVSGIDHGGREEPELEPVEVETMRSFLEERARLVREARDRSAAGFDAELDALHQAIAEAARYPGRESQPGPENGGAVEPNRPAKPGRGKRPRRPPTP